MAYTFAVIPPNRMENDWIMIKSLLDRAEDFCCGDYTPEDLRAMVHQHRVFLCGVYADSKLVLVAAAEVISFPQHKVMYIMSLGGSSLEAAIKCLLTEVSAVAKKLGASSIRGAVRPSVQRLFQRYLPEAKSVSTILELQV